MASNLQETERATHGQRRRRWHLAPRTLRWRLAVSVTALIAVSFAITFAAVYRGTGSAVSHQISSDLQGDATAFARTMAGARDRSVRAAADTARRYIGNQPYTGSAPLLFALIPGGRPVTNQPELLDTAATADEGESAQEQARENSAVARLLETRAGYTTLEVPDVGHMLLLRRPVGLANGQAVIIGVGESLAPVRRAQAGVARAFILAGVLVLVCALIAAYLLGTRLSAPLRRVAGVAARVDAGDLHPRIHDLRSPPEEVRVLADAFNHMLDRLADAFAGQRAFVADASHELRTPLTVMRGQLELLALDENPPGAEVRRVSELVQAEIGRISRLVDDMLVLAKAERAELLRPQEVDVQPFIDELWEGARVLGDRQFALGPVPAGTLRVDPDRLAQALRNLISNAVAHTSAPDGLVRLTARVIDAPAGSAAGAGATAGRPSREGPARLRFLVDDDGAGIPIDQRELVFGRFHRTDAARDRVSGGAGLGLAIVRAIAQVHGGWVAAAESPEGGARIELELPGFSAAQVPSPRAGGRSAVAPHAAHGAARERHSAVS
jgi:signal transduction histidine kinase